MITDDAVYSDKITINAPVELVWYILTDFSNYKDWNTFCPQIEAELKMGAKVDMRVDLGEGLQEQVEYIEEIKENERLAWGMVLKDRETLAASRTQILKAIDDVSCTYLTVDAFEGKLMADVLEKSGKGIERGFNACAAGLKKQAEELYGVEIEEE